MASDSQTPFQRFTAAMDGLMRVPHSEIKKAIDKEKREKATKKRAKKRPAHSRSSASSRASGDGD
ncbi:MAG TPA: hypothetical protein VIX14_03370 [Terriglobales bacterium]